MPPISVLVKPASSACNMRCSYCFYMDEAGKREQSTYSMMSPETLKNVIRKTLLFAEGSCSYMFQGEEPTLCGIDFYRQVLEYQKQYNKKKISIQNSIQTNGILIDEDW